ncbi:MAG: hypothetical protein Q8O87_01940 [bacterium]|nr:hypothetical protein [bacterium]
MRENKGYIAIITSVILAALMLMIAVTLGFSAFSSRINNLDFYSKKISYFVSRSCVDKALLELSKNINYGGNDNLAVDVYSCAIFPIEIDGENKVIKSQAQINGATTNLIMVVHGQTLSTISLEEVGKF